MPRPTRLKKCKNPDCPLPDKKFLPDRPFQDCCGVPCALAWSRIKQVQDTKKQNRKDRQNLNKNSKKIQTAKTKTAFNKFIRTLDANKPCISCGKPKCGYAWDCGHFKTVAAQPALRFDPRNAYRQGSSCNRGQAKFRANEKTVIRNYEINLVERMGPTLVNWLNGPHEPKHYSCEDLIELATMFNAETRYIEKHGKPSRDWRALP